MRYGWLRAQVLACALVGSGLAAAEPPALRFEKTGAALRLDVPEGAVLESAGNTLGPWGVENIQQVTAENGVRQCVFPLGNAQKFFRLRFGPPQYDIGSPAVTDLFVSPGGNDDNPGTRAEPLQHLSAAWSRIPEIAGATGFRINFLPGQYPCEGDCINFFSHRWGSYTAPIILRAADGPGTVTLLGGLNIENVRYLYLQDLTLRGGAEAAFGNNVFHLASSDHVLMRNCRVQGPQDITDANPMQEIIKANQCDYLYVENCDLSGTHQTVLDYFAVRYGHVIGTKIHRSGGRGAYMKGGSAYLRFEGNEVYDCREAGFQAGEGSTFTLMQPPWIHYEAYDIKVLNNVFHDVYGAGLSVAGGYNILLAHNTLYRIGLVDEQDRAWSLAQFIRGGRVNMVIDEFPSEAQAQAKAAELIAQGGWGTTVVTEMGTEQAWIPNKNVFVYNNVFYNPPGTSTAYNHFLVLPSEPLPARATNIPSPSRADENLRIVGNVIWNGPTQNLELLGSYSESTGCSAENLSCNPTQILEQNYMNVFEPEFVAPASGDFRPSTAGRLARTAAAAIPGFTWADAPARPLVASGNLSNQVMFDARLTLRGSTSVPGAFALP